MKQKHSGEQLERSDYINEYIEDDEEEYKNYLDKKKKVSNGTL